MPDIDPAVATWLATLNEVQARNPHPDTHQHNPYDTAAENRRDQRDLSDSDADWFANYHEQHTRGEN